MSLDDYGFEMYEENPFPLAYLLTFRTFGNWLHGDERMSIERLIVDASIRETCEFRGYHPLAVNIRTNHAHAVISAAVKPEKIVNDLKAYATRRLRGAGEIPVGLKVWSRGAITRYLWKPKFVAAAVDYALYSQGDVPFEVVYDLPR